MSTATTPSSSVTKTAATASTTTTSTDQDRDCANLARAALFPKRMHRDAADASHFPALLQLDFLREVVLKSGVTVSSISSVFPRHVVVVRNLADGGIQWNGEPDFDTAANVSFAVIPDTLSVRCTSNCDKFLVPKQQRAFRRPVMAGTSTSGISNSSAQAQEIVLCSDRILQSDSHDLKYKGVAKELPPKSLQAVEEVLAHQLVQVRHGHEQEQTSSTAVRNLVEAAKMEVEAAKAAECYFSRHTYDDHKQIKKGSRLQTGYSYLPLFLQSWSMNKCLSAVAREHLWTMKDLSNNNHQKEIQKAVQAAMKDQ